MRARIIVSSFILTVLIFTLGILINYGLDFVRIDTIADVMAQHELDTSAYLVEQEFTDSFGGNRCEAMNTRITILKEEIRKVGADLGSYSGYSFFKKQDYDYLKRKYFLLELRFLTLLEQLNKECNRPYIPLIFFYEIDDDESERQGFVLEDISKDYEQEVVILSLDKDYKDEPLVQLLAAKYNITKAPTIIVDSEKKEGLVFAGELNATIRTLLKRADPFGQSHDFRYVLDAAGRDAPAFAAELAATLNNDLSPFARADILLALGRITQNDTLICDSLPWYDRAIRETKDPEEQALLYETIASIDCGRNRKAFLAEAARRWRLVNNTARARMDESLAVGRKINLKFDTSDIKPELRERLGATQVTIGETALTLAPGDRILAQADRVKRDWLGLQMNESPFGKQILTTFSERLTYNESELQEEIGWHEGGRLQELVDAGINYTIAYGTLAARHNGAWYATDDQGVFRFEVPLDKVRYPTTRFLRDDLAVLFDTHGVNMLVEQSIRNNASAVISDCDHPGKVKAAQYLSQRGIPVACFPDKYLYLALGHHLRLVGSPPIRADNGTVVIGGQPITISVKEKIIVMNGTDTPYALWYYQTPANYFSALRTAAPALDITYVQVDGFNQMHKVVAQAEKLRATVIAARVFNSDDYTKLKSWLLKDPKRKAVLFHSASYPYGYTLLNELPGQVTFDDPNPRFAS